MAYKREPLSGSTHGRGIKIAATATAGTQLHQAVNDTVLVDVVTLYAYNSDVVTRRLTLEWGGVTAPDDHIVIDIPPKATVPVVVDLVLRNNLDIKGFADAANVVVVHGFVNRES